MSTKYSLKYKRRWRYGQQKDHWYEEERLRQYWSYAEIWVWFPISSTYVWLFLAHITKTANQDGSKIIITIRRGFVLIDFFLLTPFQKTDFRNCKNWYAISDDIFLFFFFVSARKCGGQMFTSIWQILFQFVNTFVT